VDELAAVGNDYPQFKHNWKKMYPSCDFFVIAIAKGCDLTVVSQEARSDRPLRNLKIPDVCQAEQIRSLNLLEFMKDAGFNF
jgi:hypothetical protein